jgi:serine protease 16
MYAQALASLSQAQLKLSSQMCKNIDWNDMLAFLSSPDAQMDGIRSWLWQTCNEVGFFQTCPSDSTCPFGRGFHNIQQDLDICRIVFGISSDQVQKNVDETLAFYGGWDLHATNVLSVNGNVDPWSTMSMRSDCADHSKCPSNTSILWVNRTSHHFWTHKSQSTDTEELVHIRGLIHDWVTDLLLRSVGLESTLVNISYK